MWDMKMEQIVFDPSFKQMGWGKLNHRKAVELARKTRRESCQAGGAITEWELEADRAAAS